MVSLWQALGKPLVSPWQVIDNFSPDFIVEVIEDGVVLYSEKSSIGSRPNEYNNLRFEVMILPHDITQVRVRLYKIDNTTNKILLNKLSYIRILKFEDV